MSVCCSPCTVGAVICPELVTEIDAIHVVVVVVNQLGDFECRSGVAIEYCPSIGCVSASVARAASNTLNEVIICVDFVDGAQHGDGCIIHPNDGENLFVDNNSCQGIPL